LDNNYLIVDFDGTLTVKDTSKLFFIGLLKFRPHFFVKIIPEIFLLYFFILTNNQKLLQKMKINISCKLLKGLTKMELEGIIKKLETKISLILRHELIDHLKNYFENGYNVVIVSASPNFFIENILNNKKFVVIATEYELQSNRFTGNSIGHPCFGEEKRIRFMHYISSLYKSQKEYTIKASWGDSVYDESVMMLASERNWFVNKSNLDEIKKIDPNGNLLIT